MEQRNLDIGTPVTTEQWEILGRTADELGPDDGGFDWDDEQPEEIRFYFSADDVPEAWRDRLAGEDLYGDEVLCVARARFNRGDPFIAVDAPQSPEEPAVSDDRERAMRRQLDSWVRDRWQALLRESGLHFERGRVPGAEA